MRLQSSSSGGLAVGEADSRYLRLAGGDLTGAVTLTKAAPSLYPADSTMPPAYSVAQEWGNASKTWTAFQVNVTNTASGSNSKIADLQVGGSSVFSFRRDGISVANGIGVFHCQAGQIFIGYPNAVNPYGVNVVFGAAVLAVSGSLSAHLDMAEMSAPAAPAANTARLFVEDDGAGKTRLCVRFPTGAVQVLATEP